MSKNNRNRNRRRNGGGNSVPAPAGAGTARSYTFQWQGVRYTLPPAADCHAKLPAGEFIDAVMDGSDQAQVRFGLTLLTSAGLDDATMTALRSMPLSRFTHVLKQWMETTGGVGPGESGSSSS